MRSSIITNMPDGDQTLATAIKVTQEVLVALRMAKAGDRRRLESLRAIGITEICHRGTLGELTGADPSLIG